MINIFILTYFAIFLENYVLIFFKGNTWTVWEGEDLHDLHDSYIDWLAFGVAIGQKHSHTFPGAHLQTSLPLEKVEERMTSGAIQAYVPAALIFVVRCHSRAKPKSVTFRVLLLSSSFSTRSRIRTVGWS